MGADASGFAAPSGRLSSAYAAGIPAWVDQSHQGRLTGIPAGITSSRYCSK